MVDTNKDDTRRGFVFRVLLENIGGFLALGAVVISAGVAVEKLATLSDVVKESRSEQRSIAVSVDKVREDVSEIKTTVAVQGTEIAHLKNSAEKK